MVDAINSSFGITPNAFYVVDVGSTTNILLSLVLDRFMGVPEARKTVVAEKLISVNRGSSIAGDVLLNQGQQCSRFNVWNYLDDCCSIPFDHTNGDSFARCATSALPWAFAADVGFIDFNFAEKRTCVLRHELSNLGKHSPRGFVSDAQFSLKLLR